MRRKSNRTGQKHTREEEKVNRENIPTGFRFIPSIPIAAASKLSAMSLTILPGILVRARKACGDDTA